MAAVVVVVFIVSGCTERPRLKRDGRTFSSVKELFDSVHNHTIIAFMKKSFLSSTVVFVISSFYISPVALVLHAPFVTC